jgi:type II secretory pathway pseudopilin PulG
VRRRLASEGGFGVVELLIAMTVLVIAVMALVAGLDSGMVALRRAADASTAAAVADKQMEAYRALPNCAIYLDPLLIPSSGAYVTDPAHSSAQVTAPPESLNGSSCTTPPSPSLTLLTDAQQQLPGADGRSYWVDTYMVYWRPITHTTVTRQSSVDQKADLPVSGNTLNDFRVVKADSTIWLWDGAQWVRVSDSVVKKVTLVVHNPDNTKTLIRETSTFTPPTGCNNGTYGSVSVGC